MTKAHPPQASGLAAMAKTLYERGWMPGTAGNISIRTGPTAGRALITGSGRSKGELTERDIVRARVRLPVGVGEQSTAISGDDHPHRAVSRHRLRRGRACPFPARHCGLRALRAPGRGRHRVVRIKKKFNKDKKF